MNYLDLQVGIPVFIKSSYNQITWNGTTYKKGQMLPWQEVNIPYETVRQWFAFGFIYHNEELEKQVKVGDRLSELNSVELGKLVDGMNAVVKSRTNSTAEFTSKRCKKSKIDDKQRGLIRSFLRNNKWIEDDFFTIRDRLLDE